MNDLLFYILVLVSAFITASSQILLKKSTDRYHKHIIFEYLNPYVIISYICYVGVLALNVFIYTKIDYRFGVVINSLSMVFIMILSKVIRKERLTRKRIVGNLLIILGIVCFTLL